MIIKRKDSYQVKLKDGSGKWISRTFPNKKTAEAYETQLRQKKFNGEVISGISRHLSFNEYFSEWFESVRHQATPGWRKFQLRMYLNHVQHVIGERNLQSITPNLILQVLNEMAEKGKSGQTRLHVYNLLSKSFSDAIEIFHLIHRSPVHKSFVPKVPRKEANFLAMEQMKKLLLHVEGNPYEVPVWLGIYLGLRIGEIQALRWIDIDFDRGVIHVRRAYSKHEGIFREYPKGRKQHSHRIPVELLDKLRKAKETAHSELVAVPPNWKMLDYWNYRRKLKQFCKELGLTGIGSHSLRHSSSELYMEHGASRDDLRMLFAHSNSATTDRYVHDRGTRLAKVAEVIQLFPGSSQLEGSQKDPKLAKQSKQSENSIV
jgi:integrase